MRDQDEDAIDAFMGSSSSFSTVDPEPATTDFGSRDKGARSSQRLLPGTGQGDESSQDHSSGQQACDSSHSATTAFNPTNDSDAAFGFAFSTGGSNPPNEFFGEHHTRSVSERHSPASQQQQPQERHDDKTQRENEEFRQLMAESDPREETRSKPSREQQARQHVEPTAQQPYHDAGTQDASLKPHNASMLDPESHFSYSAQPQEQQQQQSLSQERSSSHNTQASTAGAPTEQTSVPTMPTSSSMPSSSSATAVGSKRAPPPPPSPSSEQPFSWNDILRVQNMIERCLQQYLSKVRTLA